MTDDEYHGAHEDERSRLWSSSEVKRLRIENISLTSKVRELEETVMNCAKLGVSLRVVIAAYERGQEPTAAEINAARST